MQEMFNKDLEELKNKQTEVNNTITKMKNTLEGINNRKTEAEERISDLEDRMVEFTAAEQNKEKRMKRNEDSLRDLWDNIKCNNIRIIGVPEGEEREKGLEKIFEEIIVKNFPNRHRKGNSYPSPGSTESPRQEKPKEKNAKTNSNQTDQN